MSGLAGPILYMSGSCNGIFCVRLRDNKTLALWNPAIRRLRLLPGCPFQLNNIQHVGFRIDPSTGDFKVVHMSGDCNERRYAVYKSMSQSWELLEAKLFRSRICCD